MYRRKQKNSFTLIEMLIVIVIIGILAAALIPRLVWMQDRARVSKTVIDMNTILNAIYAQRLDYPNKRLLDITSNSWSSQGCLNADLRNTWTTSLCYINRSNAVTSILSYVSVSPGNFLRDPWWSPPTIS